MRCKNGVLARVGAAKNSNKKLRRAFLCGVSGATLCLLSAGGATAQVTTSCPTIGNTTTCSGDHSDGISLTNPTVDNFFINNLTTPIAPAATIDGISISFTGANGAAGTPGVNGEDGGFIDVDFGANGTINTTGFRADAILVTSIGGNGGFGQTSGSLLFHSGRGGDGDDMFIDTAVSSSIFGDGLQSLGIGTISRGGDSGNSTGSVQRGGDGGALDIDSRGVIRFDGDVSIGILALSLGGRSGNPGLQSNLLPDTGGLGGGIDIRNTGDLLLLGTGSIGISAQSSGGDGGAGGDGGDSATTRFGFNTTRSRVSVFNSGTITTSGFLFDPLNEGSSGNATGIQAWAFGGAGGNGQDASGAGPSGDGGDGGRGGRIDIVNDQSGQIEVFGVAVTAVSQGGVGGVGDSEGFGQGSGRNGGNGGNADDIDFVNRGVITAGTGGDAIEAAGVRLESLGGVGGDGGSSSDIGGITGGAGGNGGDGGDVDVDMTGLILVDDATAIDNASALDLFSSGARGGAGGIASGAFGADGGAGGTGGRGGDITASIAGSLRTNSDDSAAIRAQSVGGIGGIAGGVGFDIFGGAGGVGGPGGAGGAVTITIMPDALNLNGSLPQIETVQNTSPGVLAQSIGGGSGGGGSVIGVFVSAGGALAGANGGLVTVNNEGGEILTRGDTSSHGIAALSIGGGGGSAGSGNGLAGVGGGGGGGGDGGVVATYNSGTITTLGEDSHGMFALSQGGGGGDGGASGGFISLGGSGGQSGVGDAVSVENTGSIETRGEYSDGVLALSIGGGGGIGAVAGGLFAAGGSGGAGNFGGDVTVGNLGANASIRSFNGVGIQAQSFGGGGKVGGGSYGAISLGGSGGSGGDGGAVIVRNEGSVITGNSFAATRANDAIGIFAGSYGGGGGDAGDAIAFSGGFSVAIGGTGGAGGDGGDVAICNGLFLSCPKQAGDANAAPGAAEVSTLGNYAHGIFAESVGGGGGRAGTTGAVSAGVGISVSVAIGGDGGAAGDGGLVNIDISDNVSTEGAGAYGAFGQSVGGGGGSAGTTFAGAIAVGQQAAISAAVAIGGDGGAGGDGDDININLDEFALIETHGEDAHGVVAQSVGGGGGVGGNTYAFTGAFSLGPTATATFALGGNGGAGGGGGDANVDNAGVINTFGDDARGIFAQSIGGGGGIGGNSLTGSIQIQNPMVPFGAGAEISIGGSGGSGTFGGLASVNNSGSISTAGDSAGAIFAQSIGGGGGDGGSGDVGGIPILGSLPIGEVFVLEIAVGGTGGSGGHGGVVDVDNSGALTTQGAFSTAIFAQSVGGGGGTGGLAGAGGQGEVSIGGDGGAAGHGGVIDVLSQGSITSNGDYAHGVFAQSVGGGGGSAGHANFGSEINLLTTAAGGAASGALDAFNMAATQALSRTDKLKSIGRGALKGAILEFFAPNLGISIGGDGGASGDGGAVTITNHGGVDLTGNGVYGLFAQSVGGGGGNGGNGTFGLTGQIGFTGAGGSVGDGGLVTVINTGDIMLDGIGAYGILAQSVGGGGGVSGDISFVASTAAVEDEIGAVQPTGLEVTASGLFTPTGIDFTNLNNAISAFDNFTSRGGDGGVVEVDSSGTITVGSASAVVDPDDAGFSAYAGAGIFAQSVGGGGGLIGLANDENVDAFTFAGTKGGIGGGGNVVVSHDGDIIVNTIDGYGIFAQSVGCTQATVDALDGLATTIASLVASLSLPSSFVPTVDPNTCANRNGDIDVTVAGGTIQGGGGAFGAGIFIDEGNSNIIKIASDAIVTAINGDAIIANTGHDHVINDGSVIGNVELGGGSNSFQNDGRFDMGFLVDLGGGPLVNIGVLSPGGVNSVSTTTLNGSLHLQQGGALEVDLAFSSAPSDLIAVNGAANLDGGIDLNIVSLEDISSIETILTTTGGVNVLQALTVNEIKPFLDFTVMTGASSVSIGATVVSTPQILAALNLSENNADVAEYLFGTLVANGETGALDDVIASLANVEDPDAIATFLHNISSDPYVASLGNSAPGFTNFIAGLFSCGGANDVRQSAYDEGECYWGRVTGYGYDHDVTASNIGVEETGYGFVAGAQKVLSDDWRLGFSVGYEHASADAGGNTHSDIHRLRAGVAVKYLPDGPYSLSLALAAGNGWYDTARIVALPSSPALTATSDSSLFNLSFRARNKATFEMGSFYLAPMVDLEVSYVRRGEVMETGLGALNINADAADEFLYSATPALEVGKWIDNGSGRYKVFLRGGAQINGNTDFVATTRFEGAATTASPLVVTTRFDRAAAIVEAGVELPIAGRWDLRLGFDGRFSKNSTLYSGTGKLRYNF